MDTGSWIRGALLAAAIAVAGLSLALVAPANQLRADVTDCPGGTDLCAYHFVFEDGEDHSHWHYQDNVEDPIGDPTPVDDPSDPDLNDCPLRNPDFCIQ